MGTFGTLTEGVNFEGGSNRPRRRDDYVSEPRQHRRRTPPFASPRQGGNKASDKEEGRKHVWWLAGREVERNGTVRGKNGGGS